MARRPALSVVLITPDRLVRCDRRGGGAAIVFDRGRPEVDDLAVLVDAAIRGAGEAPLGREVWVLATDLWSQAVELPAGFVLASSPADLKAALAHEVDTLTSTPAAELLLGSRELAGEGLAERAFWITASTRSQVQSIEGVVERAGARLAGLAHPAGLPLPVRRVEAGADWARLEVWDNITLEVGAHAGAARTSLLARAPTSGPAHGGARELLTRSAGALPPEEGLTRVALDDADDRAVWLERWVQLLATGPPAVPAVRSVPTGWSAPRARAALMVGLLALAVGGCWLHDRWIQGRIAAAQATIAARPTTDENAQLAQTLTTQVATVEGALTELRAVRTELDAVESIHRTRYSRLLRALGRAPESIELLRIGSDAADRTSRATVIEGLADSADGPAGLAAGLAGELSGLCWRVGSPSVEALGARDDGGPWRFRLPIHDAPAPRARVVAQVGK